MTSFETTVVDSRGTVIAATGRLDMVAAPQLKELVASAVGNGGNVVVDLSHVEFMDSSGLGALVSGLRATRQSGSDLRIAGAGPQVLSILKLTNVDRILRPYDDVGEALRAG